MKPQESSEIWEKPTIWEKNQENKVEKLSLEKTEIN